MIGALQTTITTLLECRAYGSCAAGTGGLSKLGRALRVRCEAAEPGAPRAGTGILAVDEVALAVGGGEVLRVGDQSDAAS